MILFYRLIMSQDTHGIIINNECNDYKETFKNYYFAVVAGFAKLKRIVGTGEL